MMKVRYKPIGVIHSPFKDIDSMPIQPAGAKGIKGTVEVEQKYIDGLKDIEGFSVFDILDLFSDDAFCRIYS